MRRIVIITWYNLGDRNCGQTLQAYALQEAVQHIVGTSAEVKLLRYSSLPKKKLAKVLPAFACFVKKWRYAVKRRKVFRQIVFERFIRKHIQQTPPVHSYHAACEYLRRYNYDLVIIGSDQVWNPQHELEDIYFLPRLDIPKIAYAPSLMSSELFWTNLVYQERLKKYKDALNDFDAIAVREHSGQQIINSLTECNISTVLDPIFLISGDRWKQLASKVQMSNKYVLLYFVGELRPHTRLFDMLQKRMPDVDFCIIMTDSTRYDEIPKGYRIYKRVDPCDFITLLSHSELVITDSFHATAFSILLRKQFYTVAASMCGYTPNNDRIMSILKIAGLEDRYLNTNDTIQEPISSERYEAVNISINELIQKSIAYLRSNVESLLRI